MKTTDKYHFDSTDIESLREKLEEAFRVKFVPHDSYHYGDYYLFESGPAGSECWHLMQNILFEDELFEPQFPEDTVLLSIGSTERGDALKSRLEGFGFKLFKRTEQS